MTGIVPRNQGKVDLYASTQFKNRSNVTMCLLEEKLVKPEVTTLEDDQQLMTKEYGSTKWASL